MSLLNYCLSRILRPVSKLFLWKNNPKIVFVCGNVGKTSLVSILYEVLNKNLKKKYTVRRSRKNYNTEIGMPISILDIPHCEKNIFAWFFHISISLIKILFTKEKKLLLILEAGIRIPGDMDFLGKLATPDFVLFTALPDVPVHVENFKSKEDLYKEKLKIINYIKPNGHFIFLNNPNTLNEISKNKRKDIHYFSCGKDNADLIYKNTKLALNRDHTAVTEATFEYNKTQTKHSINLLGAHFPELMSLTLALCSLLKIDISTSDNLFSDIKITPGRMRILEGKDKTTIVDDTYNSSPVAILNAIETFAEIKSEGRLIAVFGEMAELGKFTKEVHKKVVSRAKKIFDLILLMNNKEKNIWTEDDDVHLFNSHREIIDFISTNRKENDLFLVKGSQQARMEIVVSGIIIDSINKNENLPRQEERWKKKEY